ncbi:ectoine/hydroxyectoine ABC transporter substrate-binding protein EhuB [Bosea vaviloviae]|uniref:Ectoine/hydroxyectoine ABC transporter substrate-binding protein EhuB n=1 Tax=Bosea vaviloviae TaxID=1526658 RepID=A0A1D7UCN3_9HYPH|nr:ectoine/hydroxyectoine ABC transporter substrate-binding protein EhuB [Bosea vaviloviae]AOO85137.1 ectoine/hydroxyectoine ABC transporter substrate-binding protein EhuB [Bosea vaviloviae]
MAAQAVKRMRLFGMAAALLLFWNGNGAYAETTKERILREGRIVVGIHNRAPWGFRDEKTGEPAGWHPDILKAAFADLGVKNLQFQVTEFGALIPGLLAGRFDAVASGLSITPDRCKQVAFGAPDLQAPDAAIVLAGNPKKIHGYGDIAAREDIVMGAGRGSVVTTNAVAAGVPNSRMLLFPDIESNLSALRAGRIDTALMASPTVIGLLAGRGAGGLERVAPFDVGKAHTNFAAIAFRKEDIDLRTTYDEQLAKLKATDAFASIMKKYGFGDQEAVPPGIATTDLCNRQQ